MSLEEKRYVSAVIVAAGNSSRMGGNINKQFIPLMDDPLIVHTLRAFQAAELIHEIVLVIKEDMTPLYIDAICKYNFDKLTKIVPGGETRQLSVAKGIHEIHPDSQYVAIHDGARPLVSPEMICRTVRHAFRYQAATAAVRVKDTIKKVNEAGYIEETPERSSLWSIQTPQVFEKKLYLKAMELAKTQGKDYTDDCQLIEAWGEKVYISRGEYTNIKITTPDDILIAESILGNR